ncbi:unnamed protein product [Gadus morhua 'NCC']
MSFLFDKTGTLSRALGPVLEPVTLPEPGFIPTLFSLAPRADQGPGTGIPLHDIITRRRRLMDGTTPPPRQTPDVLALPGHLFGARRLVFHFCTNDNDTDPECYQLSLSRAHAMMS